MGTFGEKLYQELDLEPHRVRRSSHASRNVHSIPIFNIKYIFFKNYIFASTISKLDKLDTGLGNSESLSLFKKNILQFMRLVPNCL